MSDDIPWFVNINLMQRHYRHSAFCNIPKEDGAVVEIKGVMYERTRHGWVKLSQDGSILKEMEKDECKLLDYIETLEKEREDNG